MRVLIVSFRGYRKKYFLPLSVFSLKKFTAGAFVVQKNMTGDVVLELVLLRGEKVSSQANGVFLPFKGSFKNF